MNAPRGIPLRNAPAPANAPEAPPDRTHAACPFALQRPSLILSQSHVYAACPEQWPRARPSPPGPSARTPPVLREPRSKKAPWGPADRIRRRKPHQKAACRKSARPFPWPAIPAAINERLFAPQKKRAFPGRRRILPKANVPVPPHRDPPRKRLPSPAKRAAKKVPERASRPPQRRKSHQKPRVERARGLSLARHPRSHQQTTLRAAKETGIPQSAGASSQRRTRPSLPTGTLRANASHPPRNAQKKAPGGGHLTTSNAESPIKSRV